MTQVSSPPDANSKSVPRSHLNSVIAVEIGKLPELIDYIGTTADSLRQLRVVTRLLTARLNTLLHPFHLRNPIPHLDNSLPQIVNTTLSPCRTIPRRRCRKREIHIPPLLPDQNANAFQVLHDPCALPQPELCLFGQLLTRGEVACDECRARKSRCDGTRPICQSCAFHNVPCIYEMPKAKANVTKEYVSPFLPWLSN